jgi:hypothetical protein
VLQADTRLNGVVDLVFLFVDEDVDLMLVLHEILLCRL